MSNTTIPPVCTGDAVNEPSRTAEKDADDTITPTPRPDWYVTDSVSGDSAINMYLWAIDLHAHFRPDEKVTTIYIALEELDDDFDRSSFQVLVSNDAGKTYHHWVTVGEYEIKVTGTEEYDDWDGWDAFYFMFNRQFEDAEDFLGHQ